MEGVVELLHCSLTPEKRRLWQEDLVGKKMEFQSMFLPLKFSCQTTQRHEPE